MSSMSGVQPPRSRLRVRRRTSRLRNTLPRQGRPEELPARRMAHGSGARAEDPVDLLEEQARSRLPELARSGTAACWLPRSPSSGAAPTDGGRPRSGPRTGLHAQLCGDAHLSNFGIFAAPDRRLVFSLNDFDETLPGPFEWDVKRLAASSPSPAETWFRRCAPPLRGDGGRARVPRRNGAVRRMRNIDVWYTRLDVAGIRKRLGRPVGQAAEAHSSTSPMCGRRTACARSRSCAARSTESSGSSAILPSSRRSRTCSPARSSSTSKTSAGA